MNMQEERNFNDAALQSSQYEEANAFDRQMHNLWKENQRLQQINQNLAILVHQSQQDAEHMLDFFRLLLKLMPKNWPKRVQQEIVRIMRKYERKIYKNKPIQTVTFDFYEDEFDEEDYGWGELNYENYGENRFRSKRR